VNNVKIVTKAIVLAAILSVMAAGMAEGRTTLRQEFGRRDAKALYRGGEKGTDGWNPVVPVQVGDEYVTVPVEEGVDFHKEKGTIEMYVRRVRSGGSAYGHNTLFAFVRKGDNKAVVTVYLVLEGNDAKLLANSPDLPSDVWGRWFQIPFPFKVGDLLHLAFTWGPDPGKDNKVFVNGKQLVPFEMAPQRPLAELLPGVDRLVFGGDFGGGEFFPKADSPAVEIRFLDFAIDDEIKTSFDLSRLGSAIRSVTDDSFRVAGISKKLVAGDTVTATLVAQPGGTASFDMGNVKGIPMVEVPATPGGPGIPAVDNGTYRGSYTIRPGDDYENGQIVGHFVSADNVAAEPVLSAAKWTIDTKPVVTFAIDRKDLPADSSSKARIKLVAKDANGNPVKGRHFKITLATTDEYTGTVGAGDFGKEVGASVETRWRGETDAWGEVEFDYTAGFAAKTVILSAKDLDSGGVSVDYITSFKEASIDIALTPPVSRAAMRRGMQYMVKVEASRTELTADGRSRSVIRATVLDPSGKEAAREPVTFSLSSDNGRLNVVSGTTDASGTATAEYIAGKKAGVVVVTASAALRGVSGNVSIVLLADAPAKVYLKARPAALPADGFSRADLSVKVTDANDNPNPDTRVEFRIARGDGRLDYPDRTTDRFGEASNRYTAGTSPGIATVVATVRSKVPSEAELSRAKNVLFAPWSPEGEEIRVERWLKKKGDAFVRGEPLLEYTVGRTAQVRRLAAPFDGTMGEILVEYWDRAEVGQTLAVLLPRKP